MRVLIYLFRVCQASEEKWSLGKEMVESRMQYSRMLKQLEDHLAVGQSVLSEMDDLPTGHTAGHARTLMHRAQAGSCLHVCGFCPTCFLPVCQLVREGDDHVHTASAANCGITCQSFCLLKFCAVQIS